jgi:hypothetical protein
MRGINGNAKFVEFLHVAYHSERVQVRRFHNASVIMLEFQAVDLVIICLVCDVLNFSSHGFCRCHSVIYTKDLGFKNLLNPNNMQWDAEECQSLVCFIYPHHALYSY